MVTREALAEMLRRELEASRSVSDHLSFLRQLAQEPASATLRESLLTHIGEEEAEHQAHLARLLPALEEWITALGAGGAAGFTVGGLVDKRPWHTG